MILDFFHSFISQRGFSRWREGLIGTAEERKWHQFQWSYDESSDLVVRGDTILEEAADGSMQQVPVIERFTIEDELRDLLRSEVRKELRRFRARSAQSPHDLPTLRALYTQEVDDILSALADYDEAARYPVLRESLADLRQRIVSLAAPGSAEVEGTAIDSESEGKGRVGNPNFKPKLNAKQKELLYKAYLELIRDAAYTPQRTGQVTDAAKYKLAKEFGVSESTVRRIIKRKEGGS